MKYEVLTSCLFALLMAGAATGAQIALTPVADVFMTNGPTNNLGAGNYGGAGAMMVAGSAGGKGEFKTLLRFDTSSVKSAFDTEYGAGAWTITGISIRNAGNFGADGGQPNNAIFPVISKGNFNISWIANDSWAEGTGNPSGPAADGVTYNSLNTFLSASDRALGTFNWDAPGNNIQRTWALGLDASLLSDVSSGAGSLASFLYTPADTAVGFLFNSRTFGTTANQPLLTITAIPEPTALGVMGVISLSFLMRRRTR